MATRGWEVSRCFLNNRKKWKVLFSLFFCINMNKLDKNTQENPLLADLSDADEARKAFIASEIFNRKY